MNYPSARDCRHGCLRRSCELCACEAEVKRLNQEREEICKLVASINPTDRSRIEALSDWNLRLRIGVLDQVRTLLSRVFALNDKDRKNMAKKKRVIIRVKWDKRTKMWQTTKTDSTGVYAHMTKVAAITNAKEVAKERMPSQLMIHLKNGRFQTEYTYGDDPRRSKG